jgi:hypothetical protein
MFTDLFRIVSGHGLSVPPEIAAVFRALATMEGTLTQLAPGFDIIAETRHFAAGYLTEQLRPGSFREAATDELTTVLPMLRRLPRRIDRITALLETGRLGLNVRLLADDRDRQYVTGLVHQILLTFLAATSGIMAVMLGLHSGPHMTSSIHPLPVPRLLPARRCRGSRPPHAGRGPAAGNNLSEVPKESQMESHALPDALGRYGRQQTSGLSRRRSTPRTLRMRKIR